MSFSQPFCQKLLYGSLKTNDYCGNGGVILTSCTGNSACGVDPIDHGVNDDAVQQIGICALHEYNEDLIGSNNINPGCPVNQWQFCDYDWQPHSTHSAWLCTIPDPYQCPSFGTVQATDKTQFSSVVAGGTPDYCTYTPKAPPNGDDRDSAGAGLTCVYTINDFDPTTVQDWADYDWDQCPGVSTESAVTNINGILPTLCSQLASSKGLTQYCPSGETDCTLADLVDDPDKWGTTCTQGVKPKPGPGSSDNRILIILIGLFVLLVIGAVFFIGPIILLLLYKKNKQKI